MADDIFDKFNSTPPSQEQETQVAEEVQNTGATTENNTEVAPTNTETAQPPVEADTFIETFNKRFNTQFKADDDIKPLFELPKKVSQYEADLASKKDLETKLEEYKLKLNDLSRAESSKYLESPLMQKAYVAKQLLEKHPDKDPFILQEIAMADVSKMDNLEASARVLKMNNPELELSDAKAAILHELGIDPTTPPEEWDSIQKSRLIIKGGEAKRSIKELKDGIEIPKIETQEQIRLRMDTELAKRTAEVAPQRERYSKFDKFNMGEGLEYAVPEEFKEKLPNMFDTFILQAGNDPTPENIQALEDLRDASFYSLYKKEIAEAMYKDAKTKAQAELDAKLGNTVPPSNTATASDGAGTATQGQPGIHDFKIDQQGERARHLR